jgi:hypothetical protein
MYVPLLSLRARFDTRLDMACGILRVLYISWLALAVKCQINYFLPSESSSALFHQHSVIEALCAWPFSN